jgi:hypothetical protein
MVSVCIRKRVMVEVNRMTRSLFGSDRIGNECSKTP